MSVSCLPVNMATYSSIILWTIKRTAKTATNYHLFPLDHTMRSTVIALSIRKQRNHKSYRRGRGGRTIVHGISTIINQVENQDHLNKHCSKPSWIVDWRNILPVQLDNTKVRSMSVSLTHCALINSRSVTNKSADLQVELVHNKVVIFSLTKTLIKEDDTRTEIQICPPGYKAISVPRSKNKEKELLLSTRTISLYNGTTPMTTHQWNAQTLQYLYLVYYSTWQSFTDHQINQFSAMPMTFWTIWRGTLTQQVNYYSQATLTFM